VFGTLTHDRTSDASRGVLLTVIGTLSIATSGRIDVNGKSSFYKEIHPDVRYLYGSYGGYGGDPSETRYVSRYGYIRRTHPVYGNLRAPSDLGSAGESGSAGGRLQLTVGHLQLDGRLSAQGSRSSSGGTIYVQASGRVLGQGVMDVSNSHDSQYKGGGGRIAVVGYSEISQTLLDNARMYGTPGAGAGTIFHQLTNSEGSLIVRSEKESAYNTPVSGTFCNISTSWPFVSFASASYCGDCSGTCPPKRDVCSCATRPRCPAAHSLVNGSCIVCPAGFECSAGIAMPCLPSQYQQRSNQTSCLSCPAYSYHTSFGSTSINDCVCEPGLYMHNSECIPCEIGMACFNNSHTSCSSNTYQDVYQQPTCKQCPKGAESAAGSSSVSDCQCPSGEYLSNSQCLACPIGHFCLDNRQRPCLPGTFSALEGQSLCQPCPSRSQSLLSGGSSASSCQCQAGYFLDAGDCVQCPAGSFCQFNVKAICDINSTSAPGALSCTPCPPFMLAEAGHTSCTLIATRCCANLTYNDLCVKRCPTSTYLHALPGGSEPRHCSDCTLCQSHQYESRPCSLQNNRQCSSCTPCNQSQYEVSACTSTTDRSCTACHSNCASCTGPRSNQCSSCNSFRFLDRTKQTCEVSCPKGKVCTSSPTFCLHHILTVLCL
jgi:hypothetical protein